MTGTAAKFIALLAAALAVAMVLTSAKAGGTGRAESVHTMSTFEPGSTNYEVTDAFARLVSKYAPGIEVDLEATEALPEAMVRLADGKLDYSAVVWTLVDAMSKGSHPFDRFPDAAEKSTNLRGIFYFPTGVPHLLTLEDEGIRSFRDLRGKRIFVGPANGTGTRFFTDLILEYAGLQAGTDYELAELTFTQAYDQFLDGSLDGVFYFGSAPRDQVKIASIARKVRVVGFTQSDLRSNPELVRKLSGPGFRVGCIPTHFYGPNQINDEPQCYHQIGLGIATHEEMPDDVVYAATKAFWENIDEFYEREEWENLGGTVIQNPFRDQVKLENALIGMNVPLHPGAARYYREKGLLIPADLVPDH
ncbi:TAXI family TRAP transporter solute-binding subunit [Amorphus orientalis]|uniref:TRAP transporter TAXI family solute receptor n=1 Tax=Amorphus orientalis TaxID=649198 RepID=A0AAE3VQP7_9HYPH|nr:TAXI family TRAP transporter solute-binding subunit [Amorphus orientalis]MDQ0316944.1 TRAP transporter TAXI family solute receptor [Amorphus orientalis]